MSGVLGGVLVYKFVAPPSKSEGVEQATLIKPRIAYSSPEGGVTSPSEAAAKSEKAPVVSRDGSSLEKTKAAVEEKINLGKSQKIDGIILAMTEILRLSVEQQETIRNILKEEDSEMSRGRVLIKTTQDKSELSRLRMEFAKVVLALRKKSKARSPRISWTAMPLIGRK